MLSIQSIKTLFPEERKYTAKRMSRSDSRKQQVTRATKSYGERVNHLFYKCRQGNKNY